MYNDAFIAVSFPEIIRCSLISKSVSLVNYRKKIFLDGIIIPLMTFNISSWFHAKLENWIGSNWTKTWWSVLIGRQILHISILTDLYLIKYYCCQYTKIQID